MTWENMKIGINGYEAVVPRFGFDKKTGLPQRVGSSEYCFELLLNLSNLDKKNEYFIYLPAEPTRDLPKESERWRYKIVKKRTLWTLFDLSLALAFDKERLNVFFSPTHYLPFFVPYPSVVSVLDLSYIHFPYLFKKADLLQLRLWTAYSIKKAKRILTISKASKDDIIKTYKIPKERVVVTYPGVKIKSQKSKFKNIMQNSKILKEKYGIEGDFILFVGTLQPRKNIVRLIEAFALTRKNAEQNAEKRRWNDLCLVVVGKKGWMYKEILEAPKKYAVEKRVQFLEFVADSDLAVLYQNARCFVLPSLYEGFGLPVLEAMSNGCPVVTSNVSSLPEAGGDAALYVDPTDIDDIASKINMLLTDEKLRRELIEKGYKQVKKFSWEKTAKETLKVLEEIAKEK